MPIQKHFTMPYLHGLTTLTKRFYYAERYASLPKREARLKKHPDEIVALESSALLRLEQRTWLNSLLRWLTPKNWDSVLVIMDDTFGYKEYKGYKKYEKFKKYLPHDHFKHSTEFVDPQVLYAIPQEAWDAFIDQLKHQSIVEKLGLRKHRHLWAAYNNERYKSLEDRIKHAEWIGKYHFLISLTPLLHPHVVASPLPGQLSQLESKIHSLMTAGYHNSNPLDFLTSILPALTPLFFKKVAHVPSIKDVLNLAYLVNHYAITYPITPTHHLIDSNRLKNAINWLPFSKTSAEAINTETVVNCANIFEYSHNGFLFFTARKTWQSNVGPQATDGRVNRNLIEDYLKALHEDLIAREIFNRLKKSNLSVAMQNRLYPKLSELCLGAITDDCAYTQLNALQARWHINHNTVEAIKPLGSSNTSWIALTEPKTINGVTISALTSAPALKEHGEKMKHCISSYTQKCVNNYADIFELKDETGHCSTLEIRRHSGQYIRGQHTDKNNSLPPTQHCLAEEQFIEGLNNKTIPINPNRSLAKKASNATHPSHDYTDETQEAIYDAYVRLKLLPAKLIAPNYQAMLKKLNVHALIEKTIHTALQPDIRQRDEEIEAIMKREEARENQNCRIM